MYWEVVVNRIFRVADALNRGPLRIQLNAWLWNRLFSVIVVHRLNRVPVILHAWFVPIPSLIKHNLRRNVERLLVS